MTYDNILKKGSIRGLELKNRILLAPMGSNLCEPDGTCGERLLDYYEERARGGTGLILLETAAVAWPAGSTMPNTIGFSEDRFIPGLTELAERMHRHGARIAAQLNHGGKVAQEDTAAGRPVLVPTIPVAAGSDMFELLTQAEIANFVKAAGPDGKGSRYHVMEQADIDQLVSQFADAALRAQKSGIDAVEIHAGHGYVISSFLSPAVNKRDDNYGGSRENRARLLTEIITAVRAAVGADFPILVRLDAKEYRVAGGITLDDCIETAKLCEQAGADALDISAYGNTSKGIAFTEAPLVHQPGGYLEFARAVKQVVNIPVIAVGRIELEAAEKGLANGDFDFVAMGRKLLADPELPNKLAANEASRIRPCIYCYVCVSKIFINDAVCCAVNPAVGLEKELGIIQTTNTQQRVLVLGAGPAGLEAARTLALRGFQVTLWEREKDLGGTVRIAALAYEPNGRLVTHLSQAVRELPIDIELGKTATAAQVKALNPDVVVVATGATRAAPEFKGKEQRHVFDGDQLRGVLFGSDPAAVRKLTWFQRLMLLGARLTQLTRNIAAMRLLSHIWMPLSKHIVLIGGGLVGLELAEYLVARGRQVTVLEPSDNLGAELSIVRRARVVHELREHKVNMVTRAEIDEITATSVRYTVAGEQHEVAADQVIISMGAKPNPGLAEEIQAQGLEVARIGDCQEVGYIEGAILSARKLALSL
jgi:2,4-dienoyl-CoA reductase (NADPH2)